MTRKLEGGKFPLIYSSYYYLGFYETLKIKVMSSKMQTKNRLNHKYFPPINEDEYDYGLLWTCASFGLDMG